MKIGNKITAEAAILKITGLKVVNQEEEVAKTEVEEGKDIMTVNKTMIMILEIKVKLY